MEEKTKRKRDCIQMTTWIKRIIAAVIALAMAVGGFLLFGPKTIRGSDFPTVFVHGYTGWGHYDIHNEDIAYFGLTTGSLEDALNKKGYDVHMASVGPLSSAWDRACELYAQLTGTRVDYGAAHAKKYGHERYGEDFSSEPLLGDYKWSSDHKVNLIGHSFGGTTSRLMEDLLADGAPEEVAACDADGTEVSPLFTGGHGDWVFSITILATPSNGSTATHMSSSGSSATSSAAENKNYQAHLEHFGIQSDGHTSESAVAQAISASGFYSHNDNALADMRVERATDMNASIEVQPDVFYLSYYGCRTEEDPATGNQVPAENMITYLRDLAAAMGRFTGTTPSSYTDGFGEYAVTVPVIPQTMGPEWQANDGMVNVYSGRVPYHLDEKGEKVFDPSTDYADGMVILPGQWTVMPQLDFDHLSVIGGIFNEKGADVRLLYYGMMDRIWSLKRKK